MNKLYTLLTAVLLTASAFSQAPDKMSYQAVLRDAGNALVTSQTVGMQLSILQGSVSGTAVYVETQTPTTNANGLVSLEIGTGNVISGDFTTIDWANDTYFIKTETDPTGGTSYTITGTSQLLSVPYALHAKTAENVTNDLVDDADADPTNEIELPTGGSNGQVLQTDGSGNYTWVNQTTDTDTQLSETQVDAFVANNGYVTTSNDADADPTNEIELPTGGDAGDMAYWNGTNWIAIPTTANEGATLQMINGVPTWTGGTPPIVVGSLVQGGIVYQIFQPGDAGYVVGETHGMVASATQGQSNYANAQAFINTLNTGTYSNWRLPNWADQGPIRNNLIAAGADLNFILNDDHWAGDIISSANWVFNIHFGSGYSTSAGTIHSVFGIREF